MSLAEPLVGSASSNVGRLGVVMLTGVAALLVAGDRGLVGGDLVGLRADLSLGGVEIGLVGERATQPIERRDQQVPLGPPALDGVQPGAVLGEPAGVLFV